MEGSSQTEDETVDTTPVGEVTVPDATEEIAALLDAPETSSELFEYTVGEKGVTVTGYTGDGTVISVPQAMDATPVTAIADGAFANLKDLLALKIPESVTDVGSGILEGCTSLRALETPRLGAVEDKEFLGAMFGAASFEDNPLKIPASLKYLRITGEMEALPAYALYDCNDLLTVSLPSSLSTLEKFSLSKCASLVNVEGLERLTSLGEHALSYCTSLVSVTFGKELRSIGFAALEGCTGILEMTVPFVGGSAEENSYLGYVFGASYADFSKGFYPASLARVTVLEGCRRLSTNAFYECVSLREILLPDTLEEIGIRAFYGCKSLFSVELPDSVTTVRENAFAFCDGLVTLELGEGLSKMGINAFMNCDSLSSIVLPKSLTQLPASAFYGCRSLESAELGGVEHVGAEAFRGCVALERVTGGEHVTFDKGNDRVEALLNGDGN